MATVTAGAKPATRRGASGGARRREAIAGYAFALPFLILFVVFTVGPVIASLA